MKSEILWGTNSRHIIRASNVPAIKLFHSLVFIKLTNEKSRSTEAVPNGNIIKNGFQIENFFIEYFLFILKRNQVLNLEKIHFFEKTVGIF